MKTKRQKGNQFQDWVATWLRDQSYDVHNQKTVAKAVRTGHGVIWISQRQDIFGVDLIALKQGEKPLFIQATIHGGVKKRLDELLQFSWPLNHATVQVWQKKDKAVNIKEFDGQKLVDYAKIIRRKLYRADQPAASGPYTIPPYDQSKGDQL